VLLGAGSPHVVAAEEELQTLVLVMVAEQRYLSPAGRAVGLGTRAGL
jgi:hypothetical protein